MGMSASQARLLSITSRLTNNEFRAQTITNSKLRLASETTQATKVYNEALDAEQLMYMNYDDNGDASKVELTPAVLYEYAPMKNQYSLLNTAGKIMVASLEAKNYEETNNLGEFLDRYGLVDRFEDITKTVIEHNPEYDKWKAKEPDKTNEIYWEEVPGESSSELYDSFLWATAICYGSAMSSLVNSLGLSGETLYDSDGNLVMKYDQSGYTIYKDDKSGNVTDEGGTGDNDCYCHVLAHLLNVGNYVPITEKDKTSPFTISIIDSQFAGNYTHWWKYDSENFPSYYLNDRGNRAQQLANNISMNDYKCCAETSVDITSSSTDVEKLMSDYYFDENGDIQVKTLRQKIVDLLYAMAEGKFVNLQDSYDSIQHFVNHDLNVLKEPETRFKEEEYQDDWDDWKSGEEPENITHEETVGVLVVVNDKDKAQWYTNLWNKMNGSESSNLVKYKTRQIDENTVENFFTVDGAEKNSHGGEYELYDDNLFTDANWLQFALEHGIVSMQKASFEAPAEDDGRILELSSKAIYWNTIIHTNATDIVSVPDDEAVTKAEVEYKKQLKKIKAEDKKLDTDLKKLDTEHSALQAEYDSIKETISKNVERSFKMFS